MLGGNETKLELLNIVIRTMKSIKSNASKSIENGENKIPNGLKNITSLVVEPNSIMLIGTAREDEQTQFVDLESRAKSSMKSYRSFKTALATFAEKTEECTLIMTTLARNFVAFFVTIAMSCLDMPLINQKPSAKPQPTWS